MKAEYGCSILKNSYFITITYRYGGPKTLRQGPAVRRDLAALWTKFRQLYPSLSWFQVPELTQKGQVHLHNLVGLTPDRELSKREVHCEDSAKFDDEWRDRSCLCLEHRLSAMWSSVTGGDSFVVDARKVLSARRASSYVSKYMLKGMVDRQDLHRRGFIRRWSCSRNWPRPELVLDGTARNIWQIGGFVLGYDSAMEKKAEEDSNSYLFQRVGSPEAVEFNRKLVLRGARKSLERLAID